MVGLKDYDDMNLLQLDAVKEVGSIGTAHAVTSLSQLLGESVAMGVPDIYILDYNSIIKRSGNPEETVAGVMVHMTGELKGMMLCIQRKPMIDAVLKRMFGVSETKLEDLEEIQRSALLEIGNIMISSYVNAISDLSGITIDLSVPELSVNMLGGILAVPMVELAYQTNKLMTIEGNMIYDGMKLESNLYMVPEVEGLNCLLDRMGVGN